MKPEGRAGAAALGFTVKSGWAAAVLVAGTARSPRIVDSRRIELSDPAVPESRQPYHDGFATARADDAELRSLIRAVRRDGTRAVTRLVREHRAAGHECVGAGLVVGSLIDPSSIANEHMRIHALEGQLFRTIVESAATKAGLRSAIWRERDLYGAAADCLRMRETRVRNAVKAMGEGSVRPWRSEQKAAALAAWLVLTEA